MSCRSLPWAVLAALVVVAGGGCASGDGNASVERIEEGDEEVELALHMSRLQRWTHKTALALRARNPELADFYLHEVEESIETIQAEVPTYEGHAIADRTKELLVPSVEALDGALDDRDWSAVDARVADLARSCNQCHEATDHGFVVIDLQDISNPYPQNFSRETE